MTAPIFVDSSPSGSAAGDLTVPVVPGDGNVYWLESPTGGNILLSATESGTGGAIDTYPSSWTTVGIYSETLLLVGSNIWAGLNSGGGSSPMVFAYWNPFTNANGQFTVGGFGVASVQFCLGPSGAIWGATLQNFITKYVPFASSQTTYTLTGAVTICTCSDGSQVYVLDNAGSNSAIWAVTSLGVGTKYTPGITGLAGSLVVGPDGDLWTSVVSGTTLTIYQISTSGVLLNTYPITIPSGVTQGGNIINGPDGTMWISANSILVNVTTTGSALVWSLSHSGTSVANTNGNLHVNPGASAGPQNLYVSGVVSPTTVGHMVTAVLPAGDPMMLLV